MYREMHEDKDHTYTNTKELIAKVTGYQVDAVPSSYYKYRNESWLYREKGFRDFVYSVSPSLLCPDDTYTEGISQRGDVS